MIGHLSILLSILAQKEKDNKRMSIHIHLS